MIRSVSFEKTTWNDAAVQIRGGNAEHRGRGRPRRRDRLRRAARAAGDRRARDGTARLRDGGALGDSRSPDRRHGAREGERPLVRPRRHPSARHRHDPRSGRHRHPHGPPLRAAGDGALRHPRDRAGILRALQHEGGGRRAREGNREGEGAAGVRQFSSSVPFAIRALRGRERVPGAGGAGVVEGFLPERRRSGRGKSLRRDSRAAHVSCASPDAEEVRDLRGRQRSRAWSASR